MLSATIFAALLAIVGGQPFFGDVFLGGGVACPDCADASIQALTPAERNEIKMEVFRIVNEERTKAGLSVLCLNKELGSAAQLHSVDQESCSKMSHSGCNGSTMGQRMSAAGYKYRGAGENVAWNQRSAKSVMNAWMNSAGHRANIMRSSFKNIGIGLSDKFYWTQVFGSPSSGDGCNDNGQIKPTPPPQPTSAPTMPPAPQPVPNCNTITGPDSNGKVGQQCVFPFTYDNVKYSRCTDVLDPDDKKWCSVKTDGNGKHVQGNWGYCNDGCPGMDPGPKPPTSLPTPKPPTKLPTKLPTPAPATPAPATPAPTLPTPKPPTPEPGAPGSGSKCAWKLVKSDTFCYGDWGVQRKILLKGAGSTAKMSWQQCSALAEKDAQCGDTAYGAGEEKLSACRCVMKGQKCLEAPSKTGNSVYKFTCPEEPAPEGPCSGVETIASELSAAKQELSTLEEEVKNLKEKLAAAQQ